MNPQSLHILLLEDDPADARLIQEHLREGMPGGFICTCLSTIGELLEHIHITPFDVILLDLHLPDGRGLETFLNVQAQTRLIPILILTGLDDQTLAVQAVKAGAQDYLIKGEVTGGLLARAARYAIERQRLQTELHNLSLYDSLTGLYNRRGFFMLAEEQLKLLHRSPQGLLLFLCDVDGMKPINDTFGHAQGDQNLIDTASLLRATFRTSDILARLGGDEFVVLAVGTPPANAELLQARLQVNLNKHNSQSKRPYQVSISIGVAYIAPGEQATLDGLISAADQAMYQHKRARQKSRPQ